MIKSKTEQLKELFDDWKKAQNIEEDEIFKNTKGDTKYVAKTTFCEDGIINEEIFEDRKQNPIKVLFISNESNSDEEHAGSRVTAFNDYYNSKDKKDNWSGKLRERTCALYKVITNNYKVSEWEVARNFAFMNINKRAGNKTINDKNNGKNHIEIYCEQYKCFIKREIDIIKPDIIVWMGIATYKMNLHKKYLGAIEDEKGLVYINNIPVLKIIHPGYAHFLSRKIEPNKNFENKILGKLATKMEEELKRYNLINNKN